ncbi:glycosyltransferase [Cloacibacillus sp.]|uniref:glycosyltransferase n=1 Tax=Cloacibacillus sp. TaxID=2049023 RepID=UPI0025BD1C40|nr:glycosyltransferase [Cloacibacillus sp.]MCC8059154.1 glycosyltransferase [Cloacibacillus sp.]
MQNVAVSIITYNPDIITLIKLLKSLPPKLDIYIIDNGSSNFKSINNSLITEFYKYNLHVMCNNENKGIGVALNQALAIALRENKDWLLTMDQDSVCGEEYLVAMSDFIEKDKLKGNKNEPLAVIIPTINDENFKKNIEGSLVHRLLLYRSNRKKRLMPITSGSLINTRFAETIGGFYSDLFIDAVDHDFDFSVYENNGRIEKCKKAILYHSLGAPISKYVCGIKFVFSGHNPIRYYYIYRNRWLVFYKHKKMALMWLLKCLLWSIYEIMTIMIIVDNKKKYISAVYSGTLDGVFMRKRQHQDIYDRYAR